MLSVGHLGRPNGSGPPALKLLAPRAAFQRPWKLPSASKDLVNRVSFVYSRWGSTIGASIINWSQNPIPIIKATILVFY